MNVTEIERLVALGISEIDDADLNFRAYNMQDLGNNIRQLDMLLAHILAIVHSDPHDTAK